MKLVFPNIRYKEKAIDFIKEMREHGSEINGTGGLDRFLTESDYESWLDNVISYIDIINVKENKVPALTYFYVREEEDKIIGMINTRLSLNDNLRKEGGHIGYSIRPTERNKGYATKMLTDTLKIYDTLGIKKVYLTCDKSNIASAKVIQKCNGILEEEFYSSNYNTIVQRYYILR